jgi:hypothetical protein
VCADRTHDARCLSAEDERRRRLELVLATGEQDVGEVQPARLHLDEDLAGTGLLCSSSRGVSSPLVVFAVAVAAAAVAAVARRRRDRVK